MRFAIKSVTAGAVLMLINAVVMADSPDNSWPNFRGPKRNGIAPDADLLTHWPTDGPTLVWETVGAGRGYSSLAIAGKRIYTLGDNPSTADDKDEYLLCFDQVDGKQLWRAKLGPAWATGKPNWQSSRSTPSVDAERIYVLTAHGELICCETSGRELWRKNLTKDFEGKKADGWGYSESVLIDGDKVVCTPGGQRHTLVALDKRSGDTVWSASRPDDRGAGHASIVVAMAGSTRVYVQSTGSGPMGVRAKDGKLLWTYDIDKTTAVIPTPIVRDDLVFFSAGYVRGGALLRQVPTKDAEVSIQEVYPLKRELANKHGGIVLVGDYVYGDSDDRGIPFCAELMSGDLQWKSRGSGRDSASLAAADGHLYVRYADGTMTLVKASPEALEEVGSFKIPHGGDRPGWSHPVIADGKLYLREGDAILCYELRK